MSLLTRGSDPWGALRAGRSPRHAYDQSWVWGTHLLSSRAPSRLLDLLTSSQDPEDGRNLGRSQRELRAAPSGPRGKSGKGRVLPAACPRPPCRRRLPLAQSHAAASVRPRPSPGILPLSPPRSCRLHPSGLESVGLSSLESCPQLLPWGISLQLRCLATASQYPRPPPEKLSPNNAIGGQLGVFLSALGFLSFLGLNPPF